MHLVSSMHISHFIPLTQIPGVVLYSLQKINGTEQLQALNDFSIKVFDKDGQEYGRATANVAARHEDAKFVDFIFDNRTDLEGKSKFVME